MRAKKRFGQHFLIDESVVQRIVSSFAPKSSEHTIEIGPGTGVLTNGIAPFVKTLDLIEIDKTLIPLLKKQFKTYKNVSIHEADALTFNYASLLKTPTPQQKLRFIGNLPYNIATQLIFNLLNFKEHMQDMHFMVQQEVAARITAKPNIKAYGRLSIMTQVACQCTYLFLVPPEAFDPPPKVDSAVIKLVPYKIPPYPVKAFDVFNHLVKTAFTQRRKTLNNALKDFFTLEDFNLLSLSPQSRPENLSVENWVALSNTLADKLANKE